MIHRYWTGPDEPNVEGFVWHDHDLPDEIASWCDGLMDRVALSDSARHRSNMVRWWLLWEHGGLWLDHDAILHSNPPSGSWVAGHGGWACAAAISLPERHPLAEAMLLHIERQPPSNRRAPRVSGAWPLTDCVRRLRVRMEPIPGPNDAPTWISHRWDTSLAG